jgi:hypothetical protein
MTGLQESISAYSAISAVWILAVKQKAIAVARDRLSILLVRGLVAGAFVV